MEADKKTFGFYHFLIFFICALLTKIPNAPAFWGKKKTPPAPLTTSSEAASPAYRIYYSFGESSQRLDASSGRETQWLELNYKLVDMNDVSGAVFPGALGGKILFLDSDGFSLASDFFLNQDFEKADLYGSIWIQKDRAAKIVRAEAAALRPDEMDTLLRERQAKKIEKQQQEDAWKAAVGQVLQQSASSPPAPVLDNKAIDEPSLRPESDRKEISAEIHQNKTSEAAKGGDLADSNATEDGLKLIDKVPSAAGEAAVDSSLAKSQANVSTKLPATVEPVEPQELPAVAAESHNDLLEKTIVAATVQREAAKPAVPEVQKDEQNKVTAVPAEDKMSKSSGEEKILIRGGVTNEDIAEEIAKADKKPPTHIQSSPTQLPESSAAADDHQSGELDEES